MAVTLDHPCDTDFDTRSEKMMITTAAIGGRGSMMSTCPAALLASGQLEWLNGAGYSVCCPVVQMSINIKRPHVEVFFA